MKILLYTTNFFGGGAQKITVNLANYYSSINHECIILASNQDGPFKQFINENVKLINLNKSRSVFSIPKIIRTVSEIKPDLIITTMRISNIIIGLSKFFVFLPKKSKTIFLEANTLTHLKNANLLSKIFYFILMNISYFKSDIIFANSNDTFADLNNFLLYKKEIKIVGNAVIQEKFTKKFVVPKCKFFKEKGNTIIISAGSFDKQKNFFLLYDVFKILNKSDNKIKLIILGDGPQRKQILFKAKKDNLSEFVYLPGFVKNPYAYFQNSHIFLLTSLWEGFGNVIVEALYNDLNVISVNCPGGPKDILNHGEFGMLVDSFDPHVIANNVNKLIYKKIQFHYNQKRSLEYTVQNIGNQYLKVF